MARTIGYLRVSKEQQDLEKNKAAILTFSNNRHFGHVEFVEEKVTSRVNWKKRKIKWVVDELGNGDRIIVPELSRLGRSLLEIMEILSIAQQKHIAVYSIKGKWELNGTIQSKILAMAFAMAAEIERDLISERTKEALKACRAKGVILGRPKGPGKSKLDPYREEIIALLRNGSTKVHVAKKYNVTTPNLYNWLKKNDINAKGEI